MSEIAFGLLVLAIGMFLGYLFGWARGWSAASALRDECERAVHGLPKADGDEAHPLGTRYGVNPRPPRIPPPPRGGRLRPVSGRRVFEPMIEPPSKPASKDRM